MSKSTEKTQEDELIEKELGEVEKERPVSKALEK